MRALAAHRQSTPMSQAAIRTDVHQTLDVHLNALAQIALDLALRFKDRANATQLVFAQVHDMRVHFDRRFVQGRRAARSANPVNVSKPNFWPLIGGKVSPRYTSH